MLYDLFLAFFALSMAALTVAQLWLTSFRQRKDSGQLAHPNPKSGLIRIMANLIFMGAGWLVYVQGEEFKVPAMMMIAVGFMGACAWFSSVLEYWISALAHRLAR